MLKTALVLKYFRLKKGRAMFFRLETVVAGFLHSLVLLPKVLLNHFLKRQFLVLHCHTYIIIPCIYPPLGVHSCLMSLSVQNIFISQVYNHLILHHCQFHAYKS